MKEDFKKKLQHHDTFKQMIDWSYQEVVKNIRVI